MPTLVIADVASDPLHVGFLGPIAHMTSADPELHLLQQLSRFGHPWLSHLQVRPDWGVA